MKKIINLITSHSLWPCMPSKSRSLTATGWAFKPGLSLSSTNPLWTGPNPPSPRKLLDEKLCVITLSSASVKTWRLDPTRELDKSSESVKELISDREILWNEDGFGTTFVVLALHDDEFSILPQLGRKDFHAIFLTVIFSSGVKGLWCVWLADWNANWNEKNKNNLIGMVRKWRRYI